MSEPPEPDKPEAAEVDDHVAALQAQIAAAKARRAGYHAESAEAVARGGFERPNDEELGIVETDDTWGAIASDASDEIGKKFSGFLSRFGRRGKGK